MTLLRFPEKVPNLLYVIYGFCLCTITIFISPYILVSDYSLLIKIQQSDNLTFSNFLNFHFLILYFLYFLLNFFTNDHYSILRIINLFYSFSIIYISYKIIKLKFYDLEIWSPITTITFSGVFILLSLTIQNYLASGLISLTIFYFLLKIFEDENFLNNFFFTLFSIIAMLMGSFFFLIIISYFGFIKILNLKLSKEKKLHFISNLCLIYILAVSLLIIQQINYENFSIHINLSFMEIMNRIIHIIVLFLPIFGLFFVSLFFNVFRKLNWNKDILSFLIIILISLLIFIFSKEKNYSSLVFMLPFLVIYIYRTLEFLELRFSKFSYIFIYFIPILIIYASTSNYNEIKDIPSINYVFYALISFMALISPVLIFQKQSLINTQKITTFSLLAIYTISLVFFHSQYNKYLIHNVISKSLVNDFGCKIDNTKISLSQKKDVLSLFYIKNLETNFKHNCSVKINFTTLNDLPISDIKSVNKTYFDIDMKSFMNLNIKKL